MAELQNLWPISEVSFRVMVQARFKRQPPADITEGDVRLVTSTGGFTEEADEHIVRAAQIDAPPEEVWPWLAQMMRGAGIYGWKLLETPDCSSADYLVADLPEARVGDRVGGMLELREVEPGKRVVWESTGRISCVGVNLRRLTLNYHIQPSGAAGSRLLAMTAVSCTGVTSPIARHTLEVIEFSLGAHQLARIRGAAVTNRARFRDGSLRRPLRGNHQFAPFAPAGAPANRIGSL